MSVKDKADARNWRNPLFVENAGGERIAASLTQGSVLRRKTAAGCALGSFVIECPVPAALNAFALAGFDFVVLDMEHSAVDLSRLELLILAAQACGLATLVRPPAEDIGSIGRLLDMGATGIMVPHVDSPERARAVVEQARFAPHGSRGLCPLSKYDALAQPLRMLDDSSYVVVQIEGRSAIERIAEITAVPGIDAVFVGPYDLAMSLGVPPGSEQVFAAAGRLAQSMPRGPTVGIYIDDPASCGDWAARGFSLQVVSFDGRMLANAARSVAAQARLSIRDRK
jgi:2-keto-3-deoxy-L-rhamnonate aldolase RhmA